jgi:hypothetical protein
MTPLSTAHAALMMKSCYISAITEVAFWLGIAMIAPFLFHLAFKIQMWAGAV